MAQGAPSTISVNYGIWSRSTDSIPAECPYELANLGQIVPDACCTSAPTVQPALDFSTNTCQSFPFPGDPSGSSYIRDYLNCDNGVPTFGEACTPAGTSFGNGYPGAAVNLNVGSAEECRCGNDFALPSNATYRGAGCHVAVTGYQLGFPAPGDDTVADELRTRASYAL